MRKHLIALAALAATAALAFVLAAPPARHIRLGEDDKPAPGLVQFFSQAIELADGAKQSWVTITRTSAKTVGRDSGRSGNFKRCEEPRKGSARVIATGIGNYVVSASQSIQMKIDWRVRMENILQGHFWGQAKRLDGTVAGIIQSFLDPDRSTGYMTFRRDNAPSSIAQFTVNGDSKDFTLKITANAGLENVFLVADTARLGQDLVVDAKGTVREDGVVIGTFNNETGSALGGTFDLIPVRPRITQPNLVLNTWREFKLWVEGHSAGDACIYRGQSANYPLSTSFHRTGRVDLARFIHEDLPVFADYVDTTGERRYDIANPTDRGALLGLAQHHGFPSPLLDWTRSAYVAAFFAFSELLERPFTDKTSPARVFRLTEHYCRRFPIGVNAVNALDLSPKVEQYRPASMGNARLLAQRGVFLFTNTADPESMLRYFESLEPGVQYLEIVDLAPSMARDAIIDLRRMGTTAASLFPGLDGVARALKHEEPVLNFVFEA